jgi:glycosyltransferase involved in cell wall biosynthesis
MYMRAMAMQPERHLKVLFLSRVNLFSEPGGDTVQVTKTAAALRERGHSVDISTDAEPRMRGFDLVHIFNLTRPQETYFQALTAKRSGIPVVLSPIYVDISEYRRRGHTDLQEKLLRHLPSSWEEAVKIAGHSLLNGGSAKQSLRLIATGYRRAQGRLLSMADVLLPNSHSEEVRLESDFPEARGKTYVVVPNAIDPQLFSSEVVQPLPEHQNSVLCVGIIEGRKCQLELVRALNGTELKLVLIGQPCPNHTGYLNKIKREMGRNVTLVGQIPHEDLPRYYAACKVHALVSWMETTGLASLEAGAMGANIVITDKGDTREYFGKLAHYCSPDSIDSIRTAVLAAFHAPRSGLLRKRILEKYTWNGAAEATLSGYCRALSCGDNA